MKYKPGDEITIKNINIKDTVRKIYIYSLSHITYGVMYYDTNNTPLDLELTEYEII